MTTTDSTNLIVPIQAVTTAPSTPRPFQMTAKGFFLTFPQCGARTKEAAKQALFDLLGEENILWGIIALETHQVEYKCKLFFFISLFIYFGRTERSTFI